VTIADDQPLRRQDPHERIVEVRGQPIRVAVDRIASGTASRKPALLLCNGISAKFEAFDPFVRAMPADREIIRFDVPGVGGSPTPAWPYRFSGMASLVGAMVRRLGYGWVDVLGISWGGALAQQLAFQDPSLCRRLVLVSTATGSLMVPPHPRVLRHLATPRRYRDPAYGASIAGMIYGGSARHEAGVALELLGPAAGVPTANGRGYLYQLVAGAGWTSLPLLPRTRQPTLIVSGTDDPIIPVANAKLMHRLLPHATLHLHSGGHLALGSEATALAHQIVSFLDAADLSGEAPKPPAAAASNGSAPKWHRLALAAPRAVGTAARVLRSAVGRLRSIL
jgi:poly(3-hydroxyalkanoate) depolymerase